MADVLQVGSWTSRLGCMQTEPPIIEAINKEYWPASMIYTAEPPPGPQSGRLWGAAECKHCIKPSLVSSLLRRVPTRCGGTERVITVRRYTAPPPPLHRRRCLTARRSAGRRAAAPPLNRPLL